MYALQIVGYHKSGKTTTVSKLVQRLKRAQKSVATLKDIHREDFELDPPNSNTYIHKQAGADLVIARGPRETDFLYYRRMEFLEITAQIATDWLVVEGFKEFPLPKIVCGKTEAELDELIDRRTFAIAGVIANEKNEYRGLPVFNVLEKERADELFDLVMAKVFPMLPYVDDACCQRCGLTCAGLVEAIIQGEKTYQDCRILEGSARLKIGQREIAMVPFVQRILKNNILALVSELDGWQKNQRIEVIIDGIC